MLEFGIAIAAAIAAADRARRREASPILWGLMAGVVSAIAAVLGGLFAVIPVGIAMVFAAAKLGATTKNCPHCGQPTKIDSLACVHCGQSPNVSFTSIA